MSFNPPIPTSFVSPPPNFSEPPPSFSNTTPRREDMTNNSLRESGNTDARGRSARSFSGRNNFPPAANANNTANSFGYYGISARSTSTAQSYGASKRNDESFEGESYNGDAKLLKKSFSNNTTFGGQFGHINSSQQSPTTPVLPSTSSYQDTPRPPSTLTPSPNYQFLQLEGHVKALQLKADQQDKNNAKFDDQFNKLLEAQIYLQKQITELTAILTDFVKFEKRNKFMNQEKDEDIEIIQVPKTQVQNQALVPGSQIELQNSVLCSESHFVEQADQRKQYFVKQTAQSSSLSSDYSMAMKQQVQSPTSVFTEDPTWNAPRSYTVNDSMQINPEEPLVEVNGKGSFQVEGSCDSLISQPTTIATHEPSANASKFCTSCVRISDSYFVFEPIFLCKYNEDTRLCGERVKGELEVKKMPDNKLQMTFSSNEAGKENHNFWIVSGSAQMQVMKTCPDTIMMQVFEDEQLTPESKQIFIATFQGKEFTAQNFRNFCGVV